MANISAFTLRRTLRLPLPTLLPNGDFSFEVFLWGPDVIGYESTQVFGLEDESRVFLEDWPRLYDPTNGNLRNIGRGSQQFQQQFGGERWHHFGLTFSRQTQSTRIYCDGELYCGDFEPWLPPSGTTIFVSYAWAGVEYGLGAIREIRLWSRVLSDDEVRAHATTLHVHARAQGLVCHVPLDEGEGNDPVERITGQTLTPQSPDKVAQESSWLLLSAEGIPDATERRANAAIQKAKQDADDRRVRIRQMRTSHAEQRARHVHTTNLEHIRAIAEDIAKDRASIQTFNDGKTNGSIELTSETSIRLPDAWTIEVFFRTPLPVLTWNTLTRGPDYEHHIVAKDGNELGVYARVPNEKRATWQGSGQYLNNLGPGWHHLAAVGSPNTTTFYVDGSPGQTATAQAKETLLTFGNYNATQPFGEIAELRVWNRALTVGEVYLHAQLVALTGFEEGLLAYLPFDLTGQQTVPTAPKATQATLSHIDERHAFTDYPWRISPAPLSVESASEFAAAVATHEKGLARLIAQRAAWQTQCATEAVRARAIMLAPQVGGPSGIQVDLVNAADEQPVLYIGQTVQYARLSITNHSEGTVLVQPDDRIVVRFRPGALRLDSDKGKDGVAKYRVSLASAPDDWTVADNAENSDTDTLREITLKYAPSDTPSTDKKSVTMSSLVFTLRGLMPTAAWSAKALRTQVAWSFHAPNGALIEGTRQLHLAVTAPLSLDKRLNHAHDAMDKLHAKLKDAHGDLAEDLAALQADINGMTATGSANTAPFEAYVEGEAAVLVSEPDGTGYPNSLHLRLLNPPDGVEIDDITFTLDFGDKPEQGDTPWWGLGADLERSIRWKCNQVDLFGRNSLERQVKEWKPNSCIQVDISDLRIRKSPGAGRIKIRYVIIGNDEKEQSSQTGTVWVDVMRRNVLEPKIGQTVVRGRVDLSHNGLLALRNADWNVISPDADATVAVLGAGVLHIAGAHGTSTTEGFVFRYELDGNEVVLEGGFALFELDIDSDKRSHWELDFGDGIWRSITRILARPFLFSPQRTDFGQMTNDLDMVKNWKYEGDAAELRSQWVLFDSTNSSRLRMSYVVPMNLNEVVTSEECQGFAVCDTLSRDDEAGIYAFHMTPFSMHKDPDEISEHGTHYPRNAYAKSSPPQTSPEMIEAGNITRGIVTKEWNIRSVEAGIYEIEAIMPNQDGRRKLGALPNRRLSVEGSDDWPQALSGWHIEPQSEFRTRVTLSGMSSIVDDRGYCLVRRVKPENERH